MTNKARLYWIFQLFGWSLITVINIFFSNLAGKLDQKQIYGFLIAQLVYILVSHAFRNFIIRMRWLKMPMQKLIPWVLLLVLVLSVTTYFAILIISYPVGLINLEEDLRWAQILLNILTFMLLYFTWGMIYFMYHYVESYNKSLKYEAAINEIELNKLKSQLNPHFIFNALNSIRALVDENPQKCKSAITQLSHILRNSLVMDKKRLTDFNDELRTVIDYLELEGIRFEERLKTEFNIDPDSYRFQVPPLMIQTLVENGIKHGISSLKEGGIISLQTKTNAETMTILIRNSGQFYSTPRKRTRGYGIDNTKQRLKLIFGEAATFHINNDGDSHVLTRVTIPRVF